MSLTPGDIGTDEVRAERTLSKWFRIAEVWGAIMLLDEADVFLEKRAPQDLQRNSLVSSKSHLNFIVSTQFNLRVYKHSPRFPRILGKERKETLRPFWSA